MQLNEDQLDALTEVVNIGVGRAAASLHSLVEKRIDLSVPSVRVCTLSEVKQAIESGDEPLDTSVVQGFDGAIRGNAMLAFPTASGVTLAKLLSEDELEDDALECDLAGILEEVGNIVLNGVLGSLANVFADDFQYSVPELISGPATGALYGDDPEGVAEEAPTCLLADTRFDVADSKISGSLLLAFNTGRLSLLLDRLLETAEA